MDLQSDPEFRALDVALVSIATDSLDQLVAAAQEYAITETPLLSDANAQVSEAYDVMQWATSGGEPSHTFVLVDQDGRIAWVQDYGSPTNRGVMYVEPSELVAEIRSRLESK